MAVASNNWFARFSHMHHTHLLVSLPPVVCQSSEELKTLLETAFKAQREALVAHRGENSDEEGKIDRYKKYGEEQRPQHTPVDRFLFIPVFVSTPWAFFNESSSRTVRQELRYRSSVIMP